jgi:predicted aspartyl protease
LPIRIVNPHSEKGYKTFGLIDTGADDCAIPAVYAPLVGHDLQSGQSKTISTGNGETIAYMHTTRFEIFHPETEELLYVIDDTPIDFLPNLHIVLLGVNSFLSRFILEINYPSKKFSIRYP